MRWSLSAFVATLFLSLLAQPALAQVQQNPGAAPPIVTAENEGWYDRGAPIQFAGYEYQQAGAARFFNGNSMVRAGNFNGIPLYVDTTEEPYSIVYVPIGRGLMQPYERPRRGDVAGTTGSHAPSFPVRPALADREFATMPGAASAPTMVGPIIPVLGEQYSQTLVNDTVASMSRPATAPAATIGPMQATVPEPRELAPPIPIPVPVAPPLTPAEIQKAREKVWVEFRGARWIPAGPAIPLENSGLMQTGEYAGFPVFTYAGQHERIFLPSLGGFVAPYALKR